MPSLSLGLSLGGHTARVSAFSAAARDYFARLGAAGLRVTTYDAANARLIDRLVANGGNFWPDSGAFNAMAGYLFPSGGTLIPLKDGHDAGTLNAFVTGDWNAVTGLKGDGSTKFIDSNRANNADAQDDNSIGLYVSELNRATRQTFWGQDVNGAQFLESFYATFIRVRNNNNTRSAASRPAYLSGLAATSREIAASYTLYVDGSTVSTGDASVAPTAGNTIIYGTTNRFNGRAPYYWKSESFTSAELSELDTILTDWQTDLANA